MFLFRPTLPNKCNLLMLFYGWTCQCNGHEANLIDEMLVLFVWCVYVLPLNLRDSWSQGYKDDARGRLYVSKSSAYRCLVLTKCPRLHVRLRRMDKWMWQNSSHKQNQLVQYAQYFHHCISLKMVLLMMSNVRICDCPKLNKYVCMNIKPNWRFQLHSMRTKNVTWTYSD